MPHAAVLGRWYQLWGTRMPSTASGEKEDLQKLPRRSHRLNLQIPVFVRGTDASGAEFIELTKTLNISAFGACIASQHVLRPNQAIHLTVPAPFPDSFSLIPSETPPIVAKVLRQEWLGETRIVGLEFLHPLD